jgi:hypothetical protein
MKRSGGAGLKARGRQRILEYEGNQVRFAAGGAP